jgi:putative spermidine/putrescine transport system substrate-binding protein
VRTENSNPQRTAWLVIAGLLAVMLLLAGCGDGNGDTTGAELTKVGKGEGQLELISWAGYVEPEWTKPFEQKTGCKVSNKVAGTSDEMVQLMRTGQYDGVSASGNASARLVEGGDVDPVNVSLVPNYKTIFSELKNQPYNTFDGVHYGIPHGRGANLLMWNKGEVKPPPDSWEVIFETVKAVPYKGRISVYDDPIYIADAAVYEMFHRPYLNIKNPYELDDEQFEAVVERLEEQRPLIGEYWSEATKQISAFANGDSTIGTTWQYQYFTLKDEGVPVAASPASEGFLPIEGATGWSDTWMISSEAKHPNCMYMWMNYIVSPKANAQVAEYFGEAPAQNLACNETVEKGFCAKYHAEDPKFWKRVFYWETPVADCGDGSTDCKDYNDWVKAWTAIKG